MEKNHSVLGRLLLVFAVIGLLLTSSCASLKLVSQRPAAGAAVDATAGASDAGDSDDTDATTSATN